MKKEFTILKKQHTALVLQAQHERAYQYMQV